MKSDSLQVEHRVQKVISLIVEGLTTSDIVQYVTVEFNVKDRQAYVYLSKAKELLSLSNEAEQIYNRGLAMQRLNHIFKESLSSKNYRIALNAQSELNKITNIQFEKKDQYQRPGVEVVQRFYYTLPDGSKLYFP